MRIISVTVRNCRLHRELKVDFDPSRTLIGGPNETGKSTLIEVIHRALFLKAKGNTEHHRVMNSTLYPGCPEVELAFEADGTRYLLKKRFAPSGATALAPSNSPALAGDAAEAELARILSVEGGGTGRAVTAQWAHLWVWQGKAGDDPSGHATARHGELLQRLQQIGGAAALQSDLDARAAKHFTAANSQTYTQAGKPKAGSQLEQAERNVSAASEELARATDRLGKLESSALDLENASSNLAAAGTSLAELEVQQEETEVKVRRLAELGQKKFEESQLARTAAERHASLEAGNEQILAARAEITRLEESLKPQEETVAQLDKSSAEAKARATSAEQEYRAATEAVRAARLSHDLASAQVRLFETRELHTKLTGQDRKVAECKRGLAALEEEIAKLPKVDKAKLNKIQNAEIECSKAQATLQAMATVAADTPVVAGGRPLTVGEKQILTEDTEVAIGSAIRIRIQPGGGTSLADARQAEEKAQTNLQEMLDSLALQSTQEAVEVFARRDELGSRVKAAEAELKGMGADNLPEELQSAQNEVAAAEANVVRLVTLVADGSAPNEKAAAKDLVKASERKLSDAEALEIEKKAAQEQTAKAFEAASDAVRKKKAEAEQEGKTLAGLKGQLDLLLKTYGEDTVRARILLESESEKAARNGLLKETIDAIAALQPDLLEGDRTRIARSISERTNERNQARTDMAVAQAALRSDGSEDPQTALAAAQARLHSAIEHRDSVRRRAQALVLLEKLFQEEQHTLSDQFTQPLADKISGYLQCIFGAGARAQVDLVDSEFSGLRLFRPGFGDSPFLFETLSGGAKEQTAAAVRLAMAEVLAADHGGCLPVVFDDAFAYSDPERVKQLQRMLDVAASRGLQVIILTCNPADYASLGAKTVAIRPERYVPAVPRDRGQESEVESTGAVFAEPDGQRLDGPALAPVTDEQCESFLSALREIGGKTGNQTLRQNLGWNEPIYEAVKDRLVESGQLTTGRGRGGSVSLASIPS